MGRREPVSWFLRLRAMWATLSADQRLLPFHREIVEAGPDMVRKLVRGGQLSYRCVEFDVRGITVLCSRVSHQPGAGLSTKSWPMSTMET